MHRQYNILDEKVLSHNWGKLTEVTYEISGRDGKMDEAKAELYDAGNAVTVLLYNKEQGTVILTQQFRLATVRNGNADGILTEACAGKIDDLSPEQTIRKEIEEETGYVVADVQHVMTLFMSPGAFTEKLYFYVASYTHDMKKAPGGGLPGEGEVIEIHEMPYTSAMDMIKSGDIQDAKTVILLQYAGMNGLVG